MIEVRGLSKHYGQHTAVDDVSFSVARGEILGFLGPNGAGKTTTMRMLTCYLPPSSGTATIAGYDIQDSSEEVRRRIGYLPEQVPLYRDLTVRGYLDFIGTLKDMTDSLRRERISVVMEDCGITDVGGRQIGTLSRGYRQRVGIAQALINNPEVLILDEPTVGLDPKQIVEIRNLIRGLAGDRTVVLSTHILPEVSLLCKRVIIINKGKLISDDAPERLTSGMSRSSMLDVTVSGDAEAAVTCLRAVPGVASVAPAVVSADGSSRFRVEAQPNVDIRASVASRVVAAGLDLMELTPRDLTLEDVFVQLVTEEVAHDE